MKTPFNLTRLANAIADLIKQGFVFRIYRQKNAMDWWHVAVYDTTKASWVHLVFNLNDSGPAQQVKAAASQAPVTRPAARPKTVARPKHSSRWWSRYNFEKNIMKMTLLALQERYPAEPSFTQTLFAEKLASMMSWAVSTARRHITQAAKMGILNNFNQQFLEPLRGRFIIGFPDVDIKRDKRSRVSASCALWQKVAKQLRHQSWRIIIDTTLEENVNTAQRIEKVDVADMAIKDAMKQCLKRLKQ